MLELGDIALFYGWDSISEIGIVDEIRMHNLEGIGILRMVHVVCLCGEVAGWKTWFDANDLDLYCRMKDYEIPRT